MLRIQIQEFDWNFWDYNFFGKYIYTRFSAPPSLKFYFKDPLVFKWGQGKAEILVDGCTTCSLDQPAGTEEEAIPILLTPDPKKKYSSCEIKVARGPVVIDSAEWMTQFFSTQHLSSDATGSKVLSNSFRLELKGR